MKNRNTRLFELLVVGGGLWISGCGGTDPSKQTSGTQAPVVQRVLPDGGVSDAGLEPIPRGGNGSEFW
jgi:hypothetical protein